MKAIHKMLAHFQEDPAYQARYKDTLERIFTYPEIKSFLESQEALTQEVLENSFSKLNEYMNEMEAYKAGRPGQNPGFRPELFLTPTYIDIRYLPTAEYLKREEERAIKARLDNDMMSQAVRKADLQSYDLSNASREKAMHAVLDFIEAYTPGKRGLKGLYLYGSFGIGKTYLMGAMANALVKKGARVRMTHFPTFVGALKEGFGDNTTQEKIRHVSQAEILVLDDVGAERNTQWTRDEVLLPIVEYRMKEDLPTFFTSNFSMADYQKTLRQSDKGVEEVKARRIMERLRYLAEEIQLNGPNRRNANL